MLKTFVQASLLLLVIVLAGCGSGSVRPANAGNSLPPPDQASGKYVPDAAADYRLGPQDLLEISVLGVPELARSVRVNSNGQISMPLIGGVQAGGLTIPELEQSIADKMRESYLQNPQVSVFVREFTSQRVTLEGAVKNPGIFPITGRTTLLQAIALAGGLDPLADARGVVVFRQVEGKKMAAAFDIDGIQAGKAEDPQVFGSDLIVVEQSGSKTAWRRFIESVPVFALFLLL
jgi:polysaccharide export outer membrane protein